MAQLRISSKTPSFSAEKGTSEPRRHHIDESPFCGQPFTSNLTHKRLSKTLDIGHDGQAVTLDPLGSILQFSTYHPDHGIVLASPYEQFDGDRFWDAQYVRQYRKHMLNSVASGTPGFGLRFDHSVDHARIDWQAKNQVTINFTLMVSREKVSVALSTLILNGELIQYAVLTSTTASTLNIRYTLGLGISINRASYGQLTERGPIPIPKSENRFMRVHKDKAFAIVNPHLDTHLEGRLEMDGKPVAFNSVEDHVIYGTPIKEKFSSCIDLRPEVRRIIVIRFRLYPDTFIRGTFEPAMVNDVLPAGSIYHCQNELDTQCLERFIICRNLDYILGCLAIPVSDGHVAIMTDHIALPLGWNRDNYWQLWFILNAKRNLGTLVHPDKILEYREAIDRTARGHLLWVFCRAIRPHIFWVRSYLVTGKPKCGPTFQLDTQCYPLLELCNFYDNYPREKSIVQKILADGVPTEILTLLWSKQDPVTGLFPTDETPADDEVEYPFHLSNHILLWYALTRIIQLLREVGEPANLRVPDLEYRTKSLRSAVFRHFVTPRTVDGQPFFAYLCDGKGSHRFYHDANDLPTLFAVKWGFVKLSYEVQVWKNTMDWGISPDNKEGYYGDGPFAGLGSVHTPDPWILGYFQEFTYAQMIGNKVAKDDAWRRIRDVMPFDGKFSEAVDANTGAITSRAWFSWAGCMVASLFLPPLTENEQIEIEGD